MYYTVSEPKPAGSVDLTSDLQMTTPYTEIAYLNKTGVTVHIKDRFGAAQSIVSHPASAKLDGKFHVIVSWAVPLHTNFTMAHANYERIANMQPHVCKRVKVRYEIDTSQIACDEVAFSQTLGLLLSIKRPLNLTDVFPDTSERTTGSLANSTDIKVQRHDELSLNIVIVDNVAPGSAYYLNIEGRVYRINSISSENNNLPDGVHILDGGLVIGGATEARYDLKDCIYDGSGKYKMPFVLFTNPHDAETNGDRTALHEAESRKKDTAIREQEQQILELKQLLAKAKEETLLRKERLDEVSDARKDYYESRSYSRKDSNEILSTPAKVLTGIAAILTAGFGFAKLLA